MLRFKHLWKLEKKPVLHCTNAYFRDQNCSDLPFRCAHELRMVMTFNRSVKLSNYRIIQIEFNYFKVFHSNTAHHA